MRRCKVLFIVHYEHGIIDCNTLGALSNAVGSCKVLIVVHYKHGIIECNTFGALSNAVGSSAVGGRTCDILVAWQARRAGPLLSSVVRQFLFLAICTVVMVAVLQELIY